MDIKAHKVLTYKLASMVYELLGWIVIKAYKLVSLVSKFIEWI